VDFSFLAIMLVVGIISHILRAWRWIYLLEPVATRRISLWHSFCAVIIGYAVNLIIPRGGEIARIVSISRSEHLPFAGVFPTLLIDRLLDIALLLILFGITLTVLPQSVLSRMPWLIPGGIILTLGTMLGLFILPYIAPILNWFICRQAIKAHVSEPFLKQLAGLSEKFSTGTRSLSTANNLPAIILLTVAIWFFYWLNFYLLVFAFGLSKKISPLQSLVVFTIGSVGTLIPTPGSLGSVHYMVSQASILTCGLNKELALAFATVGHFVSFILVPLISAFFCLIVQSRNAKAGTK
jgi:uncharacterized protein (TIRG00374 family)